jgi:glycosyltransferase involved in cell wall biosynthesis
VDDRALAGAVRSADHVVTVSDYNVAELRRRLPPDCVDRIHRVYNGLDLDVLPFRTQHAGEPATLLAAGRLVEKKGFADLIDALAILRDRGRALPATIVGGGRLDADLRAQVDACGLTDLVTFTGPLPQDATHDLMRRATVFAAPVVVAPDGDRDGLPTVLLEAMALGTPVVTTGVTGIPEAVQDGRTGLVVPERAPYALADAIERLLDDAALRTRLVTNARVLVEREFTASRQARELAALRAGRTRIARAAAPMAVPA